MDTTLSNPSLLRVARRIGLALLLGTLLAACGGDDDDTPTPPEPPAAAALRCAP